MLQQNAPSIPQATKAALKGGEAKGGSDLTFGTYGLKQPSQERVTASDRGSTPRDDVMKRQGRVWIRTRHCVTSKPSKVRMVG
jgi:large subunit ribosomal protein L16